MKKILAILPILLLLILVKCTEREWGSPFDPATPKESWSPSGLQATEEGAAIKITWQQTNRVISGFVILRNENDGSYSEVARIGKDATSWNDPNVTAGKKYGYQVIAYAGANQSNAAAASITVSSLPMITTSAATATSCNSASSGGNVTSDGGTNVAIRGVCWSTNSSPTVSNNKTENGSGTGTFTSNLTGLSGSTKYYVRAYATNSKGTVYGNEVNFTTPACAAVPVVTTASITNPTLTTASSGGTVVSDGGATVTARGVCWSTDVNPTISNSKTTDGAGLGSFTSSLTGLTPGTTYYVRAYATNNAGTGYGDQISFNTGMANVPVVITIDVHSITCTTAVSGGEISGDGGSAVIARGVCWSTSPNPTIANSKTTNGTGTGVFTSNITGLSPNTSYYLRAYATNSAGTGYGNAIPMQTSKQATLTTSFDPNVTCSSAVLGGNITSNGGDMISERGIVYATTHNPTTLNTKVTMGDGIGTFSQTVTGLAESTTYYVRAYAINCAGTAYGNEITITTISCGSAPAVTTWVVSAITCSTATGGGNVTSDGGLPVTARGICWNTSPNPTIANNKTTNGTGTGNFTSYITGLLPATTYYYRAYATNSNTTVYGQEGYSFTTPVPATIQTSSESNVTCNSADLGGRILTDGGDAPAEKGIVYATTPNPTTANYKVIMTSTASWSQTVTGLTGNTKYYVRAYAINCAGTAYGNEISFTTLPCATGPSVTTTEATAITCTTATAGGNVIGDGGSAVIARGVCWSTSRSPTIANSKTTNGTGTGSFSSILTGLLSGTTYYYRAYATNGVTTSYGVEYPLKTPYLATVNTSVATGVTCKSAVLGGSVTSDGGDPVSEKGVVYATTQNPTIQNTKVVMGSGTGVFSQTVTGLAGGTTYYTRAYAINCAGIDYGAQVSFTTLPATFATVTAATPSGVGGTFATLGGNVTSQGGSPVTEKGVVYATIQNPTIANSKVAMGSGTGAFSAAVSGLSCATTYYARAYATNCGGTSYGTQVSFTTTTCIPNFIIKDAGLSTTSLSKGQTVKANAFILNDGMSSLYKPFVGYYISTDEVWDEKDYFGQETQITISPANKDEYVLNNEYTIPLTVPAGNYYFLFVADSRLQYSESNERDNVFAIRITIK